MEVEFPNGRRAANLCLELLESRHGIIAELASYSLSPLFCRGDPRFANVIERPTGQLGLVDWEDSGLRDPAREIADLMTHLDQEALLSMDEWQAFLKPYLVIRQRSDPPIHHRIHLYLALFPIFWLAYLIDKQVYRQRGEQPATLILDNFAASQELRRYLARGLAWPRMDFHGQLDALVGVQFFPQK